MTQRRQHTQGGPGRPQGGPRRQPEKRSGRRMDHGDEEYGFAQPNGFVSRCRLYAGTFCVRFIVPVLLLVVLTVGLGYFRLIQGPASLKFLVAPIEKGIAAELVGLKPKIDDVVVTLTSGGGLEFQLKNLRLFEDDGELVASAPSAAMHLSVSALWSLRVVPSKVVFIAPRVFMTYSGRDGLKLRIAQSEDPVAQNEGLKGKPVRAVNPNSNGRVSQEGGVSSHAQQETQSIDVARMLADATKRARRGGGASSYLREIGFRDATVILDHEGHLSTWQVSRVSVDLDHRSSTSIVSGVATVSSARGPWTLSFRLEDSIRSELLGMTLAFRGLVPRTIGEMLPSLRSLAPFDLPVDGDVKLAVTRSGQLRNGQLDLEIGRGRVNFKTFKNSPLKIDAGLVRLRFDAETQSLVMEPSTLRWGENSLTLTGNLRADSAAQDASSGEIPWVFDVVSQKGVLSASEFSVAPLSIDKLIAKGVMWSSRSVVELNTFDVSVAGSVISMQGEFDTNAVSGGATFEGKMSAMPIAALKALWPSGLAGAAREWVGRRVSQGQVNSAAFKLLSGRFNNEIQSEKYSESRMSATMELSDIKASPVLNGPAVNIPRALVRIENNALEVVVPSADVFASRDHLVKLKSGRFTAVNLDQEGAVGEVVFKVKSGVESVVALLSDPAINYISAKDFPLKGIAGDLSGDVRLNFPVADAVTSSEVKLVGKLRLSDGRAEDVFGSYDVQGATLDFDVTESALDLRGEMLLAGVLAKLNWQYIFGAKENQQPPLRITATLDNSDRRQLGLEFSQSLQGEVSVELTIIPKAGADDDVHFRADLTNADLFIESVAWRKGPGRSAFLECDVVWGERYPLLLKNLKVAGDDIGVEGWAGIDKNNRVTAFEFPNFSLDLVSRLKVSGTLKKGPVWSVKAEGPTFDGRAFFRSLFSVGRVEGRAVVQPKPGEGIDLTAKIGTVLGFHDASLKNVIFNVSKRGGILTKLKLKSSFPSGKPLNASYQKKKGSPRLLVADSPDAGEVFRLVGFYPNLRGGQMSLKVQLDGRGPAEKTGTLWVDKFNILGDSIVSEVVGTTEVGKPSISLGYRGKKQVVREVYPFDQLRAPFSVGHGQFVLEDAYVRGPVLGATLRGKVDYTRRTLNIGGTYVPLQGLNNVFHGIPLFGELLSGPRGEGIFGMTFAIQGGMGNPQVIVNPLSFVAPGILREIFQMTPYDPRVQPRNSKKGKKTNWDVRSSSVAVAGQGKKGKLKKKKSAGSKQGRGTGQGVDGWSARTTGQ